MSHGCPICSLLPDIDTLSSISNTSRSPAAPAVKHSVPTGRRPAADCLAFDMTLLMALLSSETGKRPLARVLGLLLWQAGVETAHLAAILHHIDRLALASPANLECLEQGSFTDVARPDSAIQLGA
ncbi:hypothetical protein MY5147_004089 [Beauveria neobassiana]